MQVPILNCKDYKFHHEGQISTCARALLWAAFLILKSLLWQPLCSSQQTFCLDTDFNLRLSVLQVQNTKEREFPYPFNGQQKLMSNFNLSAILSLQTEDVVKSGDRNMSVFQWLTASARWLFCIWLQSLHTHTHTHWEAEDVKRTKKAEKWKDQLLIPRKYRLWAAWLSLEIKTYFSQNNRH